jgi:hypothetical protein
MDHYALFVTLLNAAIFFLRPIILEVVTAGTDNWRTNSIKDDKARDQAKSDVAKIHARQRQPIRRPSIMALRTARLNKIAGAHFGLESTRPATAESTNERRNTTLVGHLPGLVTRRRHSVRSPSPSRCCHSR